jgi:hypothetical protein
VPFAEKRDQLVVNYTLAISNLAMARFLFSTKETQ